MFPDSFIEKILGIKTRGIAGFKVSSRVKNHHFSKFAIFRRLNRAHQELSFKKNSRKNVFFVQTYGVQKFFLC